MIIWLYHIHNEYGEDYIPFKKFWDCREELMGYVAQWWEKEIDEDEISNPLTRSDFEYYFSETGEWGDIVKIETDTMKAEVIGPDDLWGDKDP